MRELYKRAAPHIDRVRLDGGVPTDSVQELLLLKRSNEELKNVLRLSYCPELHGNKIRTSGINSFITKGYDEATSNDLNQTSSANQPFLDKIAPTEKLNAKNLHNWNSYFIHTPITFGSAAKWTVELTLNWNGKNDTDHIVGSPSSCIGIRVTATNRFRFRNETGTTDLFLPYNTTVIIGKTSTITVVANDGNIKFYINGIYRAGANVDTSMMFDRVMYGRGAGTNSSVFSYHVFSDALNAQQVAERASVLRNIFPEIPFTRIGEQIWSVRNYEAVCTPQGTLIPEVQLDSNVEKVVNGTFDSNLSGWMNGVGATWDSGAAKFTGATGSFAQYILTLNRVYRVSISVTRTSGNLTVFLGNASSRNFTVSGTFTYYTTCLGDTTFNAYSTSFIGSIDNVSVQEVGWSDSNNAYNSVYAGTAGTVEQKTYAACKAAAMWCHYNNDATLGATYGKLYNYYAARLIQIDIDYFNAANPATPWGWRVPVDADFNSLMATLGSTNTAVYSKDLLTPNASYIFSSGNNRTSFSAIGAGVRLSNGTFENIKGGCMLFGSDYSKFGINLSYGLLTDRGYSLRLIKTT